ncbi:Phage tail protein [Desulfitobacterium hafniense]|uniref:Phage tail protein n=1 Tax=Desulfitobacterium hafniense TaxID=49338 RepID=A0A098AXE9_DESHA|nr:phage tail protein I [Desulfitobacterium hafniense]CDX01309.1 Phage tail protein [Desulfitobacterium hafniense]
MNSLTDYFLVNLLPDSLKKDKFIVALAEAVEVELKEVYKDAEVLSNLYDVDKLPEAFLDFIAYQKHVDFYDNSLPIETKRKLVKESSYLHRIKGTPKAVENLVETVFGDGEVEEWWQYDGDPYHFRVITANPSATAEKVSILAKSVESVKRLSAYFDGVIVTMTAENDLYFSAVVQIVGSITVEQVV